MAPCATSSGAPSQPLQAAMTSSAWYSWSRSQPSASSLPPTISASCCLLLHQVCKAGLSKLRSCTGLIQRTSKAGASARGVPATCSVATSAPTSTRPTRCATQGASVASGHAPGLECGTKPALDQRHLPGTVRASTGCKGASQLTLSTKAMPIAGTSTSSSALSQACAALAGRACGQGASVGHGRLQAHVQQPACHGLVGAQLLLQVRGRAALAAC